MGEQLYHVSFTYEPTHSLEEDASFVVRAASEDEAVGLAEQRPGAPVTYEDVEVKRHDA